MEEKFPIILCTSVIRSSSQGESHGGMYLVNLNTGKFHQVVDWNDQAIDWDGRGADRGLRGLAFYNEFTIAAASDEIFFYDQDFNIIKSFKNRYLKHCHEIYIDGNTLYLSSTGYDSVILFDLVKEKFIKAYCYRKENKTGFKTLVKVLDKLTKEKTIFFQYNPNEDDGPSPEDTHHINNVFVHDDIIYLSGTKMTELMQIDQNNTIDANMRIPKVTHNVQFYKGTALMNSTGNDCVVMYNEEGKILQQYEILKYDSKELLNNTLPDDHARQGFGRGLCTFEDYIIAGSSPATISIYHYKGAKALKSINLTKDIRNAIHGLEVYPYLSANKFV